MAAAARRFAVALLLLIALGLVSVAVRAQNSAPAIAEVQRDFVDSHRKNWNGTGPRPLVTTVWYPAELSAGTSKSPLILLSHGSGGSAAGMTWLGRYLAQHDYIAAAVNHIGSAGDEIQLAGQFYLSEWQMWERPRDLSAVLDRLLADPTLGPHIDRDRIGAAGFSLGGYTVIALVGGRLDRDRLYASAPPPPPGIASALPQAIAEYKELQKTNPVVRDSSRHARASYRDRRIRAVFALAPAIGSGFAPADLALVTVPVRIVVGRDDLVTPPAVDAQHYADLIHGASLTILPGEAGHFIKDQDAAHQAQILDQVSELAVAFFDRILAK